MGPVWGLGSGSHHSGGAVPSEHSVMTEMPEGSVVSGIAICNDIAETRITQAGQPGRVSRPAISRAHTLQSAAMRYTASRPSCGIWCARGKSQYLRVEQQVAILTCSTPCRLCSLPRHATTGCLTAYPVMWQMGTCGNPQVAFIATTSS